MSATSDVLVLIRESDLKAARIETLRLLNEMEVALRSMRRPAEVKRILRAALQRHGRRVGEQTGE